MNNMALLIQQVFLSAVHTISELAEQVVSQSYLWIATVSTLVLYPATRSITGLEVSMQ